MFNTNVIALRFLAVATILATCACGNEPEASTVQDRATENAAVQTCNVPSTDQSLTLSTDVDADLDSATHRVLISKGLLASVNYYSFANGDGSFDLWYRDVFAAGAWRRHGKMTIRDTLTFPSTRTVAVTTNDGVETVYRCGQ